MQQHVFANKLLTEKTWQNHGLYLLMLGMSKAFDTVVVSIVFKYLNNIDNDELYLINIILDTQLEKQQRGKESKFSIGYLHSTGRRFDLETSSPNSCKILSTSKTSNIAMNFNKKRTHSHKPGIRRCYIRCNRQSRCASYLKHTMIQTRKSQSLSQRDQIRNMKENITVTIIWKDVNYQAVARHIKISPEGRSLTLCTMLSCQRQKCCIFVNTGLI